MTWTARHTGARAGDPDLDRDGGGRPAAGWESKLSPSHRPAASASAAAALGLAVDCHLFKVGGAGPAAGGDRAGPAQSAPTVTRRPGGRAAVGQDAGRPAKSGELEDTCKVFIVRVAALTQGP